MRMIGIAGWSGSGKTTLMVKLLPELTGRGLTVSTFKHAHHNFDTDKPGKDSYEHRMAGAREVMVSSANRWAIVHENRGDPEPEMKELIARMSPVDLLIIEGSKTGDHEKLEVYRRSVGEPLLCENDASVVAVATDEPMPDVRVPVLDLNDVAAIADFIVAHCGLDGGARRRA